jgi:hypothetical protein
MMTPNELADELDLDPKRLRRWLRSRWQGPGPGGQWDVTEEQARLARAHFGEPNKVVALSGAPKDAAPDSADVEALADWSPWVPIAEVGDYAPRSPGVYTARDEAAVTVYVGMAGERRGEGLRGRLLLYLTGKAAVSGLGEAVFDRALADADWVRERLEHINRGEPERAKTWARLAVHRAALQVRWAETADRAAAVQLERDVLTALKAEALWNRLR